MVGSIKDRDGKQLPSEPSATGKNARLHKAKSCEKKKSMEFTQVATSRSNSLRPHRIVDSNELFAKTKTEVQEEDTYRASQSLSSTSKVASIKGGNKTVSNKPSNCNLLHVDVSRMLQTTQLSENEVNNSTFAGLDNIGMCYVTIEKHEFIIRDRKDKIVLIGREETQTSRAFCSGQYKRAYDIVLYDTENNPVAQLSRSPKCLISRVFASCGSGVNCKVLYPVGVQSAEIVQCSSIWLRMNYNIKDASGNIAYRVNGPVCRSRQCCCRNLCGCTDTKYPICTINGDTIGMFMKKYSNNLQEVLTGTDSYAVYFPRDAGRQQKITFVGMMILLSFMESNKSGFLVKSEAVSRDHAGKDFVEFEDRTFKNLPIRRQPMPPPKWSLLDPTSPKSQTSPLTKVQSTTLDGATKSVICTPIQTRGNMEYMYENMQTPEQFSTTMGYKLQTPQKILKFSPLKLSTLTTEEPPVRMNRHLIEMDGCIATESEEYHTIPIAKGLYFQ